MIGTLEMKDAVLKRRAMTKKINRAWSGLYAEDGFCLREHQVDEWKELAIEHNRLALMDAIETADTEDVADLIIALAKWMRTDKVNTRRDYLADKMSKLLSAAYELESEIEEL